MNTLQDYKAKTDNEKALTRLLNISAFLATGALNEEETKQFKELYKDAKNEVLRRLEA